jgi:hypothetical protein
MAVIILSHEVKDFASWRPAYDADSARRDSVGLKELAVGTQSDNANKVFVIWEGDPSKAEKMMQDPEIGIKMKEAGVLSAPEITVINT